MCCLFPGSFRLAGQTDNRVDLCVCVGVVVDSKISSEAKITKFILENLSGHQDLGIEKHTKKPRCNISFSVYFGCDPGGNTCQDLAFHGGV